MSLSPAQVRISVDVHRYSAALANARADIDAMATQMAVLGPLLARYHLAHPRPLPIDGRAYRRRTTARRHRRNR